MKKRIKIISITITSILLALLFSPIINAEEITYQNKLLTIWMPGITKDNYFTQIYVSEEKYQLLIDEIYTTLNIINTSMIPDSSGVPIITDEEWQKIRINVCAFIDSIKSFTLNFPDIDTNKLTTDVVQSFFSPLPGIFRPKPVISAGIGNTWIPFYDYETFLGFMLRPMLTKYQFGFTHVGGLAQCRLTIGKFFMVNTCFTGIFINLGDIGIENIMGPTMYVGTVFLSRI